MDNKNKLNIQTKCDFSIKRQENHISYKPFGGCFEDENDSQYDWNPSKEKQNEEEKYNKLKNI